MTPQNNRCTRRVLAVAILAALSGGALAEGILENRHVETRIYGFLNGEIESVKAVGGATPYASRGRISDGNSRIGFAGSIGLRDDIRGIWQIEGSLNNFDEGGVNGQGKSATIESRNTFVGIESKRFGRFIVGNNDSVYRSLVGSGGALGGNLGLTVQGVDVWNNTSAQLSGNADSLFGRGEARYKNSAHYLSPEWRGFQAGASYGFDEQRTTGDDRARYSLAAKYSIGAFSIGAGYDRQQNTGVDVENLSKGFGMRNASVSGVNTSFYKLLATYKFPTKTSIGLGFESGSYGYAVQSLPTPGNIYTSLQTGSMKQRSVMASLSQEVGYDVTVMLAAGKLGKLDNTTFAKPDDFGATQISLGATYKIDEQFMPYVYFTRINNKAQQNVNLGQSPLHSNNSGQDDAFLAPGNSPRAFGFGFIARF